jgi:hypothetical protein
MERGNLEPATHVSSGEQANCMTARPNLEEGKKQLGTKELERLFETFASFAGATSPVHSKLWPRNEQLLLQLIENWTGDVTPLMTAIHPYDSLGFTHYEGASVRALHQKLCAVVLPKFARQLMGGFGQIGFVDHLIRDQSETYNTRCMLFSSTSPLWKELRVETIRILNDAATSRVVQENAYELLQWFDYQLREHRGSIETENVKTFLSDKEVSEAIWAAGTATPLSSRAVARIQRIPEELSKLGIAVEPPAWWATALRELSSAVRQPVNDLSKSDPIAESAG